MLESVPAVIALIDREIVFIDGVRYYSHSGVAHHRPRGKYSSIFADGEDYVLTRPVGEPTHIPYMSELFGANDVWWTSNKPQKPKPQSAIAVYPHARPITAREWYARHVGNVVVLDYKAVMYALGSLGGGHGRTTHPTKIHPGVIHEPGAASIEYLKVTFSNEKTDVRDRDLLQEDVEKIRWEAEVISEGPLYEDQVVTMDTEMWLAGDNFVFSSKELALEASEAGFIGKVPQPKRELPEDTNEMIVDLGFALGIPPARHTDFIRVVRDFASE